MARPIPPEEPVIRATRLRDSCDMATEFSTPNDKSQGLSLELEKQENAQRNIELNPNSHLPEAIPSRKANIHLYWLVISALLLGTPIVLLLYLPLALPEKLFAKGSAPQKAIHKLRKIIFMKMVGAYMSLQKFYKAEYRLDELRKLERSNERFLMVSNHRSHLDVFLFLTQIEGIQVLAKKALFSVPILNWMMILTEQIPAEKGDWKSLEAATQIVHQRIQNGKRVLIFPEFKRCEGGLQGLNSYSMLPFQIALKEKVKILPFVVLGTDQVWPKGTLNLNIKPKQIVLALEPIDTVQYDSAKELRDKVHSMTQNKIRELYHEV